MSGATVAEFIAYWEGEGQAYVRRGDYAWMAALVPGQRVLEIGCGIGFGTQALVDRKLDVLAIDSLPECLSTTEARLQGKTATLLQADLTDLSAEQREQIEIFAPETVVCWLMGAPADVTSASASDAGRAVAAYREKIHRIVAELAVALPSVQALHLVDRTAIAWQAKDIGRDTLVSYHGSKTLLDLPLAGTRNNALYRKLGDKVTDLAPQRHLHPSFKNVVPVLASLLAERKK